MDFTNWVTVAAPNEWPANVILPGVWTSICSLKMDKEVEEVLRFVRISPSSNLRIES